MRRGSRAAGRRPWPRGARAGRGRVRSPTRARPFRERRERRSERPPPCDKICPSMPGLTLTRGAIGPSLHACNAGGGHDDILQHADGLSRHDDARRGGVRGLSGRPLRHRATRRRARERDGRAAPGARHLVSATATPSTRSPRPLPSSLRGGDPQHGGHRRRGDRSLQPQARGGGRVNGRRAPRRAGAGGLRRHRSDRRQHDPLARGSGRRRARGRSTARRPPPPRLRGQHDVAGAAGGATRCCRPPSRARRRRTTSPTR